MRKARYTLFLPTQTFPPGSQKKLQQTWAERISAIMGVADKQKKRGETPVGFGTSKVRVVLRAETSGRENGLPFILVAEKISPQQSH